MPCSPQSGSADASSANDASPGSFEDAYPRPTPANFLLGASGYYRHTLGLKIDMAWLDCKAYVDLRASGQAEKLKFHCFEILP